MMNNKKPSLRVNRKTRQGIKATRGRPLIYDEVKQKKWYILTPTVISAIRQNAEKQGLTESEGLERLIRYINALPLPQFDKKSDEV